MTVSSLLELGVSWGGRHLREPVFLPQENGIRVLLSPSCLSGTSASR